MIDINTDIEESEIEKVSKIETGRLIGTDKRKIQGRKKER